MAEVTHLPIDWQRAPWPTAQTQKRVALIELGLLSPAERTPLFEMQGITALPLLQDHRQPHLTAEGPWLLEVTCESIPQFTAHKALDCALQAWIESRVSPQQLAIPLAPAMVACPMDEPLSLLRFYLPQVIKHLHAETHADWYHSLFGGIEQWYRPMPFAETFEPTRRRRRSMTEEEMVANCEALNAIAEDMPSVDVTPCHVIGSHPCW